MVPQVRRGDDSMFEGAFSPMHWLLVLFIVLLLFGPKKLPEIGKGLGTAIRGFRDALSDGEHATERTPVPPAAGEPSRPPGPSATT
ncbi:MAG: twin-arginine translocase TatA/TatE family subunit [Acidobacteriota bacterium]